MEENPYLFCHDPALGPPDYQEGSVEREVGIEWSWIAEALLGVIRLPCLLLLLLLRDVWGCWRHERVWRVLHLLLMHLPEFLKNRALVLSTPAAIPDITRALTEAAESPDKVPVPLPCPASLRKGRVKVATLIGPPDTVSGELEANLADFICPSLAILVAYRDNLEKRLQVSALLQSSHVRPVWVP